MYSHFLFASPKRRKLYLARLALAALRPRGGGERGGDVAENMLKRDRINGGGQEEEEAEGKWKRGEQNIQLFLSPRVFASRGGDWSALLLSSCVQTIRL